MKKLVALLALTASGPALAQGQLPKSVVPVLYDISVTPDAKALTFSGSETVTVDVREATRTVVLNGADLSIGTATWDNKPVPHRVDAAAQQVTLTLPAEARPGRHQVAFTWTGKINQSAAGLFATDYTNVDGTPGRMLATQFEAPDARRFAPMWDEPAFKAKFRLSAVVPAGQLAISNMPGQVTRRADGTQFYAFGETPIMSSYLLFLGMGDLERKTVKEGNVEIGMVTRRGVVDQGDYALASARKLLRYYNDYFGQPYPLPKMDMIAGPGSSQFFGAMENWGAIFYFENTLLFDPKISTASTYQRIHTVVAHEMAHQWFGDLVTMRWWDDLWLNEGFASWMESKATNDLNPGWQARAEEVAEAREGAMGIDATAVTHPIVRPVQTPDQISESFDSITYAKGQAVIGMIESTIDADPFRDGIRRYMAKYKYNNTVTDQLWGELPPLAGRPVAEVARGFTLQGGVPLVTLQGATCANGVTTARLVQGRFGLDAASKQPQTWTVPLRLGVVGQAGNQAEGASVLVSGATPAPVTVKGCGTLVLNQGKGSYTRTRYDDAGHAAIVRDYPRLALEDRVGQLGDDFALASSGDQDLSRWIAVMDRVAPDAEALEWQMVSGELSRLTGYYEGTPVERALRAKAAAKLEPVLARIGYDQRQGEAVQVTNVREDLIAGLGSYGSAEVAARARAYVARLATDPAAIPPAIRGAILATYASNATPAEWDALLAITKAERSPVAKNQLVGLLGIARDPANTAKALALLETDSFTAQQKAGLLRGVSRRYPDRAFDWAAAHRATVDGWLESSTKAGFIVGLGTGSNDPAMPGKITAFANANLPEASRQPARRTIGIIAARKAIADRLRPAVTRWVGSGTAAN